MPTYQTPDFPLLRASTICPCCNLEKPKGALVCWGCYRFHDARNGGLDRFADVMRTIENAMASRALNNPRGWECGQ